MQYVIRLYGGDAFSLAGEGDVVVARVSGAGGFVPVRGRLFASFNHVQRALWQGVRWRGQLDLVQARTAGAERLDDVHDCLQAGPLCFANPHGSERMPAGCHQSIAI